MLCRHSYTLHNITRHLSRIMTKATVFIALIFMIKFMMVFAEDDDVDIMGEIIVDLFTGAAMEICSHYATCSAFMTIIAIITLIVMCIGCMTGNIQTGDVINRRTARRIGTQYVGGSFARTMR